MKPLTTCCTHRLQFGHPVEVDTVRQVDENLRAERVLAVVPARDDDVDLGARPDHVLRDEAASARQVRASDVHQHRKMCDLV